MSGTNIKERFRVTFKKKEGRLEEAQKKFLEEYVSAGTEGSERDAREKLVSFITNPGVDMVNISGLGETTVDNASQFFTPDNANKVVAKYIKGESDNGVVVQVHSKNDAGDRVTNEIMNNMTCENTQHVQDLIQYIKNEGSNKLPPEDTMYVDMNSDPPRQKKKESEIMQETKALNIDTQIKVLPSDTSFYKGKNKDFNYLVYSGEPMLPKRFGDGNVVRDLVGRCLMIGIPVNEESRPRTHRPVFGFVVCFYDKNDELIKKVLQKGSDDSVYGVLYFDPKVETYKNLTYNIGESDISFENSLEQTEKKKDSLNHGLTHVSRGSSTEEPRWKNLPEGDSGIDGESKPHSHGHRGVLDNAPFMKHRINKYKKKISRIIKNILDKGATHTVGGSSWGTEEAAAWHARQAAPPVAAATATTTATAEENEVELDNINANNMDELEMQFGIFSLARLHSTWRKREYIGLPYTILGSPYGIESYEGVNTQKITLKKNRVMFHKKLEDDETLLAQLFGDYARKPESVGKFFNKVYNENERKSFYAGMMLCFKEYFLRSGLINLEKKIFLSAERDTMKILMPEWNDSMNDLINLKKITWQDQNSDNAHGITTRFRFGDRRGGQGKTKKKLPLTYKKTINKDKRKSKIKRKRKTKGNTNI